MKYLYYSLLICLPLIACSQKDHPTTRLLTSLEKKIDSLRQVHHAAGLAVAVVQDDKVVYKKGFGYRDYENKLLVDENTVFGIGSCSKAFTAAVLGSLQDDGLMHLNDKPSKYLKDLRFSAKNLDDSIRIHHLLNHSTGISAALSESSSIIFITPNKYDLIPRIAHINSLAGIEEEFIYNNLMYTVAAMSAEKASGKTLNTLWEEVFFKPLGMKNTYADVDKASENSNFSFGYAVDSIYPSRVKPEDMSTRGPAGSIFSSVNDMSKWMMLWLNDGNFNGKQLLSENYINAARDTQFLLPNNPRDSIPVKRYYGYGWGNWYHKGKFRSEHSGGVSGYVSNVVMFPKDKFGIVILTNQTMSSLPSMVTNLIVESVYPSLKEPKLELRYGQVFNMLSANTPTVHDTMPAPSQKLEDLQGVFEHPGFGKVTFSKENKTVFADFPLTRFQLIYAGDDIYYDYNTEDIPHVYWNFMSFRFLENEEGMINQVAIDFGRERVIFQKI